MLCLHRQSSPRAAHGAAQPTQALACETHAPSADPPRQVPSSSAIERVERPSGGGEMKLMTALALLAATVIGSAHDCWAWGATGHEWVIGIANETLPDSVPASCGSLKQ